MERINHFLLDGQYELFLRNSGMSPEAVLARAGISESSFRRKNGTISAEQYYELFRAIAALYPEEETPVRMGTIENMERFSPAMFAAYCSKDGLTYFSRLQVYKRLIGPLELVCEEGPGQVTVSLGTGSKQELPELLIQLEFTVLLHLLRKATGQTIVPLRLTTRRPIRNAALEAFAGAALEQGEKDAMVFSRESLSVPFLTRNDMIWDYFEPELKKRLDALNEKDCFAGRVQGALTELLAKGRGSADDVARELGVSRRTMQRRLAEEGTTFQQELNRTRRTLAEHYIRFTDLPVSSVAFLLGYHETNSFLHAFTAWTGMSVREYRRRERRPESE